MGISLILGFVENLTGKKCGELGMKNWVKSHQEKLQFRNFFGFLNANGEKDHGLSNFILMVEIYRQNNLRLPGIRTYAKSMKVKFSNGVNEKFHRN